MRKTGLSGWARWQAFAAAIVIGLVGWSVASPDSAFAHSEEDMAKMVGDHGGSVRAAMTSVPIWQYVIAVALQVIAIYFLVRLAGRIYSGAMLKTSGKLKAKEALVRSKDGADAV